MRPCASVRAECEVTIWPWPAEFGRGHMVTRHNCERSRCASMAPFVLLARVTGVAAPDVEPNNSQPTPSGTPRGVASFGPAVPRKRRGAFRTLSNGVENEGGQDGRRQRE